MTTILNHVFLFFVVQSFIYESVSLANANNDRPPPRPVIVDAPPLLRQDLAGLVPQQPATPIAPDRTPLAHTPTVAGPDPLERVRLLDQTAAPVLDETGNRYVQSLGAEGENEETLRRRRVEAQRANQTIRAESASLQGTERTQYMSQPTPYFPQIQRQTFVNNFDNILRRIDTAIEASETRQQNYAYNAMGNFNGAMQLMNSAGQLTKTIQGMDSLNNDGSATSGGNAPAPLPSQAGLNSGGLPFPTRNFEEKNTRGATGSTARTGEGAELTTTSDGRPAQEPKFMAGMGELKDNDLDKMLGITDSKIVPPGFLENLGKQLAQIQREKALVDLLEQAGVDANIASHANVKALPEFGALAGKAIAAKTEEDMGYSAGGGSRSQGSAEEEIGPNDILRKITESIGNMEQVKDSSPKAKDFKNAREMLASNLDSRLKLARKEAESAKIALNPNAVDARNPAQANCAPGENCLGAKTPSDASPLSTLIFLALGVLASFAIIFWLKRDNKNSTRS